MTTKQLGPRIRDLRQKRGLTVAELAAQLGRSVGTVFCWEWGKRVPRTLDQLELLADKLGVTFAELVADAPEERDTAPPPPTAA